MARRPQRPPSALPSGRIVPTLVVAAAVGVLAFSALRYDFVADDAFITFRYVRNLIGGNGLVYNVGDRVEGFSSPLHVLIVAALGAAGLDLVDAGRAIGLVAAIGLVVLAAWLGGRWAGPPFRPWAAALAAGLLGMNPHLAVWSLGGLEATLYAFVSLGAAAVLLGAGHRAHGFGVAAVAAAAATLTRPEAGLIFLGMTVWFLVEGPRPARRRIVEAASGVAVFAVVVGAWVAFRYVYYGEWLPNTYHAKSAFTTGHLARGLGYLGRYALHPWVVPVLIVAAVAVGRRGAPARLLAVVTAAQWIAVVLVGGDGLPAYRFIVPTLGPLAVLAALGAGETVAWARSHAPRLGVALPFVFSVVVAAAAWPRPDLQWSLYQVQKSYEVPTWSLAGRWLRDNVPADTTLAAVPIGAVGYYSGLPVIDMLGMTDRHIARVKTSGLGTGWAGHEKTDGAYVLSREPDILLLGNVYVGPRDLSTSSEFPPYTSPDIYAREKDVVTDPRFARDYVKAAVLVAEGRYLNCFIRREFAQRTSAGP